MIYILRNSQQFGPYDENTLLTYVNSGQILIQDRARDSVTNEVTTVDKVLKRGGLKPCVAQSGGLMSQLRQIGKELIVPASSLRQHQWLQDKRLLMLSLVGLAPLAVMYAPVPKLLIFYAVSLYFACIWGLFFYYLFKTAQVSAWTTIKLFFITQIGIFIIFSGLQKLNLFYIFTEAPFPLSWVGYVLGVGVTEELAKALPVYFLARRAREPLIPQTLVFYGLMSGIAFGVFEGVQYQTTVNIKLDYSLAYFFNIARLTGLPFLHAIWCGIAGYFISFAQLYPKYRKALYVLAIAVPAFLHGTYDTFCGSLPGMIVALPVTLIGVVLLMTYLRKSADYQSHLRH